MAGALRRGVWNAAGAVCFGVGLVGVALPGIPTTGPLILALACFTRGSPRLERWLLDHPRFGPPLREWRTQRTIPKKAKGIALCTMLLSAVYLSGFSALPLVAKALALVFIALGAIVVGRIPTRAGGETGDHRIALSSSRSCSGSTVEQYLEAQTPRGSGVTAASSVASRGSTT